MRNFAVVLCLVALALPAYAEREEFVVSTEVAAGQLTVKNHGEGLLTVTAKPSLRSLDLKCSALSVKAGGAARKWMRLTLASDPAGINFTRAADIDNATRIDTPRQTMEVPRNRQVEVRIDHENSNAVASLLQCDIDLTVKTN